MYAGASSLQNGSYCIVHVKLLSMYDTVTDFSAMTVNPYNCRRPFGCSGVYCERQLDNKDKVKVLDGQEMTIIHLLRRFSCSIDGYNLQEGL
jgi:hypothetical protein